jgi:hypothetical protein
MVHFDYPHHTTLLVRLGLHQLSLFVCLCVCARHVPPCSSDLLDVGGFQLLRRLERTVPLLPQVLLAASSQPGDRIEQTRASQQAVEEL